MVEGKEAKEKGRGAGVVVVGGLCRGSAGSPLEEGFAAPLLLA